jgi:O-glycosyl hydrolase
MCTCESERAGSLSPIAKDRAAYALYLARAAKAYRAAGLNFTHLAIQNEPNQGDTWNGKSCGDSYPKMHVLFVLGHLSLHP